MPSTQTHSTEGSGTFCQLSLGQDMPLSSAPLSAEVKVKKQIFITEKTTPARISDSSNALKAGEHGMLSGKVSTEAVSRMTSCIDDPEKLLSVEQKRSDMA